jgi:2-hydroxychromene-2-carboxylate isomerase
MDNALDFYFDFSSPYGYLASEKIDQIAAKFGRKVRWHPVLLGVVFRETGAVPLTLAAPLKSNYYLHDFSRSARYMGIPYTHPANFPIATQQAARAYYWLHGQDCAKARAFAHAAYRALFAEGRDISELAVVLDLAVAQGVDRDALSVALASPELKARLKQECEDAIANGVFGSPYILVDGEPFFGADRLPQLERWLETGGF